MPDRPLAIVTGARGNLGPVWCAALEGAGMEVVRVDVRGGDGIEQADVTDRAALSALRDRLPTPQVLVNNAGIDQPPDPDAAGAASDDDFLRVLDVNTRGTFVCSQVFGEAMREAGGGSIVNIGSLYASISPDPTFYDHIPGFVKPAAYGASKAGVVQLTKWLARHLAPRARERSLAGRRARRPGPGVPAQVLRARPARAHGRAGRPDRAAALPRLGRLALRDRPRAVRRRRVPRMSGSLPFVANVIAGEELPAAAGETFVKIAPATGEPLSSVARSRAADVDAAVSAAAAAQPAWAGRTVEERGRILRRVAQLLERDREQVAAVVGAETGKSPKDSRGETDGAMELGYFIAGEGRRFYGKTMPSATPNRQAMTLRQPLGVAGLIIAANTPIANVAWKVFPALLCGNAAVLKASEDSPETALVFARLAAEAGLPPGVLNIVNGFGEEAGQPLVEDRARRRRLVHGLDGGRPPDRARRGRAAREGVSRARRQEPARRLRRRRPGAGRGDRGAVGLLQRGPAVRRRIPADRVRRRVRPLPRPARRAARRAAGRLRPTTTTSGR